MNHFFYKNKKRQGFTLIELMIVVAIIAVISAIAIPNLLEARKSGNETSAGNSLRTIHTAQEQYRRKHELYAADFSALYADSRLIPRDLDRANAGPGGTAAATAKSGYFFKSNPNFTIHEFMLVGGPSNPGSSGDYLFFVNAEGTLYRTAVDPAATADENIDGYAEDANAWDPDSWQGVGN